MRGKKYQESRWAEASRKSINSRQRLFLEFCCRFEIPGFESVNGQLLIDFVVWTIAADKLHSVDTVRTYLSAVKTLCHMFGFECDTPSTYWKLDWTLVGIQRELQLPSLRKKPITPEILLNLITRPSSIYKLNKNLSWEKQLLLATTQTCFILAFFTMKRASNLLPPSLSDMDPRRQMVWGRIKWHLGGVVCKVVLSKTIQFSERIHEIALASRPGSPFCPVSALNRLGALRHGVKCGVEDLIFQIPVKGVWRPLCKDTVVVILRMQLKKMGLDPRDYSFHSFRHGGVQAAVRAQPSVELIKLQSGHSSDAFYIYTQMPGSQRMVMGAKMLAVMEPVWRDVVPAHDNVVHAA
jgi:integrase